MTKKKGTNNKVKIPFNGNRLIKWLSQVVAIYIPVITAVWYIKGYIDEVKHEKELIIVYREMRDIEDDCKDEIFSLQNEVLDLKLKLLNDSVK